MKKSFFRKIQACESQPCSRTWGHSSLRSKGLSDGRQEVAAVTSENRGVGRGLVLKKACETAPGHKPGSES